MNGVDREHINRRYKILGPGGFKNFIRIDRKEAECFAILLGDTSKVVCSIDHVFDEGIASELRVGDKIGGKTIEKIEKIGKRCVYTPIEVEGHRYISRGIVSHNCSFIGSTATLIDGNTLSQIIGREPIRTEKGFDVKIYREPESRGLYVMGVDSSTGVGNDSSSIQIIQIYNRDEYEQVLSYSNNKIKPSEFARIVAELSYRYNNAMMVVESNDIGRQVCEELWYNIGCGNILNTGKSGIGTRATPATKLDAVMMLKKAVESKKLKLNDIETIAQLNRYEEVAPNIFRGAKGQHDDLVSALYWAVYCLNQPQIDLEGIGKDSIGMNVDSDYEPMPILFDESSDNSDFWRSFN